MSCSSTHSTQLDKRIAHILPSHLDTTFGGGGIVYQPEKSSALCSSSCVQVDSCLVMQHSVAPATRFPFGLQGAVASPSSPYFHPSGPSAPAQFPPNGALPSYPPPAPVAPYLYPGATPTGPSPYPTPQAAASFFPGSAPSVPVMYPPPAPLAYHTSAPAPQYPQYASASLPADALQTELRKFGELASALTSRIEALGQDKGTAAGRMQHEGAPLPPPL